MVLFLHDWRFIDEKKIIISCSYLLILVFYYSHRNLLLFYFNFFCQFISTLRTVPKILFILNYFYILGHTIISK